MTGQFMKEGAYESANSCPVQGQDYLLDKRIRELSKGARQGYPKTMTEEEAKEARSLEAGRALTEDEFPIVESEQDGFARFSSWLKDIFRDASKEHSKENQDTNMEVLMVAHSALIRAVLKAFFSKQELEEKGGKFEVDGKKRLKIPNTSLSVIDVTPNPSHPVWNGAHPPSDQDVEDASVWKARLVELTNTDHFAFIPKA
jgi:broad specificity phosphatase PhoE